MLNRNKLVSADVINYIRKHKVNYSVKTLGLFLLNCRKSLMVTAVKIEFQPHTIQMLNLSRMHPEFIRTSAPVESL
jgi:hypothetical protein